MQTFAVLAFGRRRGMATIALYLVEGLFGLPVFCRYPGKRGLAERRFDRDVGTTAFVMLIGNIAIYALGLLWLAAYWAGINRPLLEL